MRAQAESAHLHWNVDIQADCFFIHGTQRFTYNGNIASNDEPGQDNEALGQATPFYESCDIYAPFYRQATFCGGDWEAAYDDIKKAFAVFLLQRDPNRPIVLCGHSQGGVMVEYLLRDYFEEGTVLREALAVAFTPGIVGESSIQENDAVDEASKDFPGVGSTLVWCTVTEGAEPEDTLLGKYGVRSAVVWCESWLYTNCSAPRVWQQGVAQRSHDGGANCSAPAGVCRRCTLGIRWIGSPTALYRSL